MPHDAAGVRTGAWYAGACLLILGVMPIISNGRPPGASALTFALLLTLWEVVLAVPVQLREWRSGERGLLRERLQRDVARRVALVTLGTGMLFGISTWAYVLAFQTAGAVNAAIALQSYPLVAAALEAVVLGRRKTRTELAFTGVIVVALYYLATGGTWRMSGVSGWFAVALSVPVMWSIAHITLRQALVSTTITPLQVTTSRLVVSGVFLVPLALAVDGPRAVAGALTSPGLQLFGALMGLAYYLELVLWFYAVRQIDVSLASAITVPAPAVTLLLAVLFLGEHAHTYQVVALGAVLVGLFGLVRAGAAARARQRPLPDPVV
ncbi:DMT family transporter [Kineosporia sp. A_224]|uniref:DMT family transporter n=1 Tax=Kineosporia sp. A_224 TaxID=1962180 RepID=UPI0018EA0776|nr:DMT family transporter [Kineosporia sp. A_224]